MAGLSAGEYGKGKKNRSVAAEVVRLWESNQVSFGNSRCFCFHISTINLA